MKKNKTDGNMSILPEKVIKQRKNKILEKRDMIGFFKKFIFVIICIYLVFSFIYGILFVDGQIMYPAIKDGDVVVYFRLDKNYQVGDVVSVRKNKESYISRIIAREGDIVDITEDGELLVNGNVQQEEIYFLTYPDENGITFPYRVSKDSVFVLGDFRTGAIDSRQFGQVQLDEIEGKVITIIRRRGF